MAWPLRPSTWRVALLLSAMLAAATPGRAAPCGGDVPCACGDTVRGIAALGSDLVNCPDDGLRLKEDAVLDCAGHEIRGRGEGEGILLDQAVGAVVRNCVVMGFRVGVRVRGGRDNEIRNNEIASNGRYGIELSKSASATLITDNWIDESGDEGVHIGTGADGTVLVGNEIHGSHKENLYVLSSDLGIFRDNLLTGSGAAAVYLKHSSENVFEDNQIWGHVVHVRGHAQKNRFTNNVVDGGRFIFEAYKDKHPAGVKGWTRPADNVVSGGAVLDTKTCFQFKGASDNQAVDVGADGCKAKKQSKKGGQKAKRNPVSLVEVGSSAQS